MTFLRNDNIVTVKTHPLKDNKVKFQFIKNMYNFGRPSDRLDEAQEGSLGRGQGQGGRVAQRLTHKRSHSPVDPQFVSSARLLISAEHQVVTNLITGFLRRGFNGSR